MKRILIFVLLLIINIIQVSLVMKSYLLSQLKMNKVIIIVSNYIIRYKMIDVSLCGLVIHNKDRRLLGMIKEEIIKLDILSIGNKSIDPILLLLIYSYNHSSLL